MKTTTQEIIEQKESYITSERQAVTNLTELLSALRSWTAKTVDKRFFIEHFLVSNEYRDWTKYEIRKPAYSWSRHTNEISISSQCKLELQSRETAHIIEVAEIELARINETIARQVAEIEKLKAFDEPALIAELRALFFKYGEPESWGKVLDVYEVKYPNN